MTFEAIFQPKLFSDSFGHCVSNIARPLLGSGLEVPHGGCPPDYQEEFRPLGKGRVTLKISPWKCFRLRRNLRLWVCWASWQPARLKLEEGA